jgi:hypothetical protein
VPVLQKVPAAFPAHCESLVHLPQKLTAVMPQSGPAALAPVQSPFVRQLPAAHAPDKHRCAPP